MTAKEFWETIKNRTARLLSRDDRHAMVRTKLTQLEQRADQRAATRQAAGAVDQAKVPLNVPPMDEEGAEKRSPDNRFHVFRSRIKPPNAVLGVAFTTVQLLVVVVLLLGVAVMGAVVGVAKAYVDTTPMLDIDKIQHQALSSFIYDGKGNLITNYTGMENRVWATIEEMPQYLQDAIVAIEDSRFYTHNGVDVKRIVGSFLNNMSESSGGGGGSTLTQQLIKNTILTSERTYKRKIQEAWLSMQLETQYSKDQILEAYLNTIPMGQSNYGVKAAAEDYFGKELKDLTLRECAMLAGLTKSPYTYDPRRNTYSRQRMDITNKRTDTVLMRMYELGYIDKTQYESSLQTSVSIKEKSTHNQMYDMPYFVEYAMDDIKRHMLKARGLDDTSQNREKVDMELRTGGYRIELTVDPDMQRIAEEQLFNYKKYPTMKAASRRYKDVDDGTGNIIRLTQPQAATSVIDYRAGEIKAIVGGRQVPTTRRTLNRATAKMSVGSAIKPIAVYAPAFDKGSSPATISLNVAAPIKGWGGRGYPGGQTYDGTVPLREAVQRSINIVAARTLLEIVSIEDSAEYLNKMGINDKTSIVNKDGPGLALGTSGISVIQMAGAFGTLGNKGEYREPLSFRKITDSAGNTVLDAKDIREVNQVFQPGAAWMMVDVLKDAVSGGTGSGARLKGYTTAGKTGTHSDGKSITFSGLTGYYSCSVWIGHDSNYPMVNAWGGTQSAPLFKAIMQAILDHQNLPNKDIIEDSPKSLGLVQGTVCGVSGLRPNAACSKDPLYKTVSDWFLKGTVPGDSCNMHYEHESCTSTHKLATQYCPEGEIEKGSVLLVPKSSPLRKISQVDLLKFFPTALLDFPDVDDLDNLTPDNKKYAAVFCNYHTEQWAEDKAQFDALSAQAAQLVSNVRTRMRTLGGLLSSGQTRNLKDKIATVETLMATKFVALPTPVDPAKVYTQLQTAYVDLQNYADAVLVEPTPTPTPTPSPVTEPTTTHKPRPTRSPRTSTSPTASEPATDNP